MNQGRAKASQFGNYKNKDKDLKKNPQRPKKFKDKRQTLARSCDGESNILHNNFPLR